MKATLRRHAAGVTALVEALRGRGLVVDDFELSPPSNAGIASRVAFAREDSGDYGYAIVMTVPRGVSTVTDLSFAAPWGRDEPVVDVARDIADLDFSWVDFGCASNREVAALRSLTGLLSEAADDAIEDLRDSRYSEGTPVVVTEVLLGLDGVLSARRSSVLAATALLEALVSGAPIEWALRRAAGAVS